MTQVGMRLALSLGMMKKTALLLLILTTFFTGCRNSPEVIEEECTQPSCLGSSATLEPPTGLSISGISETSATVTWTDPNFQGSFIIDVS